MPELVWYVAYGSNLSADRFRRYLDAARDTSPPRDWRAVRLPYALYFAKWTDAWGGGGVAFVDHEALDPPPTRGRAWLVTADQFLDVYAMENGMAPGAMRETDDLADRWYGRRVACGDLDGRSMVTFTAPWAREEVEAVMPSEAYVDTIVSGLAESHGLARADALACLGLGQLRP